MRAHLVTLVILALANFVCVGQELIRAEFELIPPPHFLLQTQHFFLAGNSAALGNWAPDKVEFKRDKGGGHLKVDVVYPKNQLMEVKITLGDWTHVEVTDANQAYVSNHRYQCSSDCRITIAPENFRIEPFHKRPLTTVGEIQYLHEITFPALQNKRSISIYLPPGYHQSRSQLIPSFTPPTDKTFSIGPHRRLTRNGNSMKLSKT